MPERDLLIVLFAPATVGLIVMACRRLPLPVYLVTTGAVIGLSLVGLGESSFATLSPICGRMAFATVFIGAPTLAAFGVGRLIATHQGGAFVFAASSTSYLLGLGIAAGIVGPSPIMMP